MNFESAGYSINNFGKINIILGKNGAGKSTALKAIEFSLSQNIVGQTKYITPERGGKLAYEPNVDFTMIRDPNWHLQQLRQNQWGQFKEQTMSQYRKLELLTLREIEKNRELRNNLDFTFETLTDKINSLLSVVKIVRAQSDFKVQLKKDDTEILPSKISSGESELITLAIECFAFQKECSPGGDNYLFLDEPDVHLHPDLQVKFAKFIQEIVSTSNFKIFIATHSTALLSGFCGYEDARFDIITFNQKIFNFKPISDTYQKILPIFGAHPLSNLFNESPILLVEGEDDVRIWQQAIRTSQSLLKIYPCSANSITELNSYENEVENIINSVYDSAKAYSLRDRDETEGEIDNLSTLIRFKLSCRNSENLILSDEVLNNLEVDWETIKARIEDWIEKYTSHPKLKNLIEFKDSNYDRKHCQLKEIRNIIIGLTNSNKPWEVAVGQVIGNIKKRTIAKDFNDNKICNFLGNKIVNELL